MAQRTERIRFTVPAEVKADWKAEAETRGMSLIAFLRDVTADLLAAHALEVTCAEIEFRSTGATLQ